ncbi:hypothetical protein [Nocardiopsis lambiniae]|uniref:Uncharacterized protein n=1 Tax=Nocardiopsis lambiniae TaxID=3075539 RepID=A0ABU2M809_9ACTN|nr:hypothetical protein [Nocardiopsis sp. DSM 44743]MDT0328802.1 hypothetical protein [Nocardiopsis sp. DSM 44743]
MAENTGRGTDDIIDDALRLVDGLQRKLLIAGVKRGVGAVTSPPAKGDVWEEAVRLEDPEPRPVLEEVFDIVRTSAPEIAGHLGRAGLGVVDALGRTWGVVERSLERPASEHAPDTRAPWRSEGGERQVTSG